MSNKSKSDNESQPESSTALAEPQPEKSTVASPSFADRVGQKSRVIATDPFPIATDIVARVRLMESKMDHQMAIKFGDGGPEDRPSQAVIDTMKGAGYRWNPSDRIWAHPVRPESAMTTRIDAERLYQQVCRMIHHEKGTPAGQDIPF